MIKFIDFISAPEPKRTKVKFNMNAGDPNIRAWDLLLEDDPRWIGMNAHKERHPKPYFLIKNAREQPIKSAIHGHLAFCP